MRNDRDAGALKAGCHWSAERAIPVRNFFARVLKHSKGKWAGQAFDLLDWQWKEVIGPLFGWLRADGTRRFRTVYIEVPKKSGKALAIDTPIPTPSGWTVMGDLKRGDEVFGADGKPCRVVAVGTVEYGRPCYRVSFTDGDPIVADAEHEWAVDVLTREYQREILTTAQMSQAVTTRADGALNLRIDIPPPLQTSAPSAIPIPPYTLGAWLGDGHSAAARLTCSEDAIAERINGEGVRCARARALTHNTPLYSLGSNGRSEGGKGNCLQSRLRAAGLLNNKHIPEVYFRAAYADRVALLQGLMDTDGYVAESGECEYTSIRASLRDGLVVLCRTLGLKPRSITDRARLNGRDCGPRHRIHFHPRAEFNPCSLQRKAVRAEMRDRRWRRSQTRHIAAVDAVASVPVRCIQVDRPDGMFLAGEGLVPTHNSTMLAGVGLWLLVGDKEAGAEVYSTATKRDQAAIIHGEAIRMTEASPALARMLKINRTTHTIVYDYTQSKYAALASDSAGSEGLNVHGLIVDELHAWSDRPFWDTLRYSMSARAQPITAIATTAGIFDKTTLGWQIHEYASKISTGEIDDDEWLVFIRGASQDDDPHDVAVQKYSNPSYGVTINPEELAHAVKVADDNPSEWNQLLRYRFNVWTQSSERWIQLPRWDACGGEVDLEAMTGKPCYVGVDLSGTQDLTATVYLFVDGDRYVIWPRFFCPADTAAVRAKRDRVKYDTWIREGFMEATQGDWIDHNVVLNRLLDNAKRFTICEVAVDPAFATQFMVDLADNGLTVARVPQTPIQMTAPIEALERLIYAGLIAHGNNPILRWMAGNVQIVNRDNGLRFPSKKKSTEKIDGIVALLMALNRALAAARDSVYESRGIRVL